MKHMVQILIYFYLRNCHALQEIRLFSSNQRIVWGQTSAFTIGPLIFSRLFLRHTSSK